MFCRFTPLTQAARILGSHPAALRKAINQFQIVERDNRRRRLIPNDVLALFRRTKAACGYLYPAWVRTREELLAAAAKIPQSEITELEARNACHQHQEMQTPRFKAAALQEVVLSIEPTVTSAHKEGNTTNEPNRRSLHSNQ
jgi:hypothetical protein